jgi:two-component sensor histidine kinase
MHNARNALPVGATLAVLAGLIGVLAPHFDPLVIFLAAVSLGAFLAGTAAAALTAALGLIFVLWSARAVGQGPHFAIMLAAYVAVAGEQILLFWWFETALAEARAANTRTIADLDRQKSRFEELQHRVGNHMQVVASILTLQKARVGSDPSFALAALDETRERVVNMSRVHRRLYDPASAGKSVQQHLDELCADFAASTPHGLISSVAPDVSITDPLVLETMSLLIGEAISNSLKHAFSEGETGTISVSLVRSDNRHIVEVRDNGRGAAAGFDPVTGPGLGLKIMQSLAGQLGGRLEVANAEGFTIRVAFDG